MALQIIMKGRGSIKIVDGKAKTTVRLPEDLYWKFQETKTERRIVSDEAAYAQAVELWLAAAPAGTGTPTSASPQKGEGDILSTINVTTRELSGTLSNVEQLCREALGILRRVAGGTAAHGGPDPDTAATADALPAIAAELAAVESDTGDLEEKVEETRNRVKKGKKKRGA